MSALQEFAPIKFVEAAADEATALRWLNEYSERCDVVMIDIYLREGSDLGVLHERQADGQRVDGAGCRKQLRNAGDATQVLRTRGNTSLRQIG